MCVCVCWLGGLHKLQSKHCNIGLLVNIPTFFSCFLFLSYSLVWLDLVLNHNPTRRYFDEGTCDCPFEETHDHSCDCMI